MTHVLIATPEYRGCDREMRQSVYGVQGDLHAHGIRSTALVTGGDSLVTRARNVLVEAFRRDEAYTHLLQWDEDIECTSPACVRAMLDTGHDVIAGSYALKGWRGGLCLRELHPELRYVADHEPYEGDELVALFDTAIVNGRYLSEDYNFCRLWREAGGDVFVYGDAKLRHWGRRAYEHDIVHGWADRT